MTEETSTFKRRWTFFTSN